MYTSNVDNNNNNSMEFVGFPKAANQEDLSSCNKSENQQKSTQMGGFGFGNIDFFMSGALGAGQDKTEDEDDPLSIALTVNKGMYEEQVSHYHVKDYKNDKKLSNSSFKIDFLRGGVGI